MASSVGQFIERIKRSGLPVAHDVAALIDSLPPEQRPNDGQALGKLLVKQARLTRYQAAAILQGKEKSLAFGEYVVLDKLGQGGMGLVLHARHRRMKRDVAIKVLPKKALDSPDAVDRFYREVEAAAKLIHSNIVVAHDAGEHGGVHYLVMEHVDGKDLSEVLHLNGPLPVQQAVNAVIQAARGLAYAHDHGVVHRDIKPGNLLLGRDGSVKVLDMGLARVEAPLGAPDDPGARQLTQTGQVMGTVDYMAPEQAMDTRAADARADVYSLGCTLYRILTGENVYTGDTLMKRLMAHQNEPVPSLREKRAEVSEAIDAAFQKMVAKDPAERPQSMYEVIDLLDAALEPAQAAVAKGEAEASASGVDRYQEADFTPPKSLGPDADTLVLYRFNEGEGTELTDSSSKGHHGAVEGAVWMRVER